MPDMLVKLYDLPPLMPALVAAARGGAMIRRAVSGDKRKTLAWVRAGFASWVAETKTAFSLSPVTCFIALREQTIVGFACYDATCPNFFGPTAVAEDQRGHGDGDHHRHQHEQAAGPGGHSLAAPETREAGKRVPDQSRNESEHLELEKPISAIRPR